MVRNVLFDPREGDVLEAQDGRRFEVIEIYQGRVSIQIRAKGRSMLELVPLEAYGPKVKSSTKILHTLDEDVTLTSSLPALSSSLPNLSRPRVYSPYVAIRLRNT